MPLKLSLPLEGDPGLPYYMVLWTHPSPSPPFRRHLDWLSLFDTHAPALQAHGSVQQTDGGTENDTFVSIAVKR